MVNGGKHTGGSLAICSPKVLKGALCIDGGPEHIGGKMHGTGRASFDLWKFLFPVPEKKKAAPPAEQPTVKLPPNK